MKLFNGNDIKWDAYHKGFQDCENNAKGNPFVIESDEWYSWNRGWNSNYNNV